MTKALENALDELSKAQGELLSAQDALVNKLQAENLKIEALNFELLDILENLLKYTANTKDIDFERIEEIVKSRGKS